METAQPANRRTFRILGWILLLGLISGLVGCGAAYGITTKAFVAWRALPPLPEAAKSIAGATTSTVDVETQSGRLLRFDPQIGDARWNPVTTPQTETDSGCEQFNRSRPLKGVIDQRVACHIYADGYFTAVYALRDDGKVYAWTAGGSGFEVVLLAVFPAVCAPLGMAAGLIVGLIRNRKRDEYSNAV